MNKNIITPVDLIQTLREAADSLDDAAEDLDDWGSSYMRSSAAGMPSSDEHLTSIIKGYHDKASEIRELIKEYET